jgi:Ca2+-binding RTX toxin-like protein
MATKLGTPFDDEFSSDADGDVLLGLDGNDNLTAAHNNVTLDGGSGDDNLFSNGAVSNTTMEGGAGLDFLTGNGTNDTASYASSTAGVTVDLFVEDFGFGAALDDGHGSQDGLISIENVTGSAFADSLTGDSGANVLQGGAGDDTLTGEGGADVFKYSFDVTAGGGGETHHFTDFFAARGGKVVDGEVADGTKLGKFASSYAKWLKMLVKEEGLGDGGFQDFLRFGELESFTWKLGHGKKAVTHEVRYFDTWTSGDGGEDIITSIDGLDTILDFSWGEDQLDFSGVTQAQFEANFSVDDGQDVTGDSQADTVMTINGSAGWSLTLAGVSGHDLTDFSNNAIMFS